MTARIARLAPLALAAMILSTGAGRAGEFLPWSGNPDRPVTADAADRGQQHYRQRVNTPAPFGLALLFWKKLLTRVDGPRCAHLPSCSRYAGQALHRHGAVPGLFMVLDRLLRGARSSSLRRLPLRGQRLLDPLEEAEFWRKGYRWGR